MLKDLHGTVKEDILDELNKEVNQKHFDFVKSWFQEIVKPYHSFILPYFLTSSLK